MELAPLVGLADRIVDLVESGNTLKANGLVPLEHIADISSRLVVNKARLEDEARRRHRPARRPARGGRARGELRQADAGCSDGTDRLQVSDDVPNSPTGPAASPTNPQ